MLRQIPQSELQGVLVIGVFILTLAVFLFFFVRALRMRKPEADRLGNLPLQDEPEPPASPSPTHE